MNIWQYTHSLWRISMVKQQHLCLTIAARSGMKPLETKNQHWQELHFPKCFLIMGLFAMEPQQYYYAVMNSRRIK